MRSTCRMAGGRNGRPLSGLLRFQIFHIEPGNEVAIDINGVAVAAGVIRRDYRLDADSPTTWFELSCRWSIRPPDGRMTGSREGAARRRPTRSKNSPPAAT